MKYVIPIRGIKSAMSRLQDHVSATMRQKVVKYLFMQTVTVCQNLQLDFTVLTSDIELIEELNARNLNCYQDAGTSLNSAITEYIQKFNFEKLGLIMPDIPGMSIANLQKALYLLKLYDNILVPSIDQGTAVAVLHKEFWEQRLLGENSAMKIQKYAKAQQIQVAVHIINDLSRDLDTYDDWQYFHAEQWVKSE